MACLAEPAVDVEPLALGMAQVKGVPGAADLGLEPQMAVALAVPMCPRAVTPGAAGGRAGEELTVPTVRTAGRAWAHLVHQRPEPGQALRLQRQAPPASPQGQEPPTPLPPEQRQELVAKACLAKV